MKLHLLRRLIKYISYGNVLLRPRIFAGGWKIRVRQKSRLLGRNSHSTIFNKLAFDESLWFKRGKFRRQVSFHFFRCRVLDSIFPKFWMRKLFSFLILCGLKIFASLLEKKIVSRKDAKALRLTQFVSGFFFIRQNPRESWERIWLCVLVLRAGFVW